MPSRKPRKRRGALVRRVHTPKERAAIVARVCEQLADGATVTAAIALDGINRSTLWRWLHEDTCLREAFDVARIAQAHALAEDVVTLADTATAANANAVRLAVDARKWFASKLAPRLFGDAVKVEHAGAVAAPRPRVLIFDPTRHPKGPPVLPLGVGLVLPDNGRAPEVSARVEHSPEGWILC